MVTKKTSSSKKSVYTKKEEEELLLCYVFTFRLKVDPETGKQICEICSDLLSVSVEGDYPIACRKCGMKVSYQSDDIILRYIRRVFFTRVQEEHLFVTCAKRI